MSRLEDHRLMARTAAVGAPLRHPAFQRLWLGLSISYLGDQFTIIALLWFVLQLTASGAAVGLVILCFDLPGVVTGAILGRLLDRYQPRLVMGLDNLARAALIATIPTLYALGSLQLWHVFVLASLAGALSPATTAGVRAFVPHLVDDAALNRANTLTAISLQFSYLAGPLAAGFAVARLGGPWALFIDAASFLLMGLLVLTLPTITREPRVAQHAAANRWFGFGAMFSLRHVPALTLLSLVFFFSYGPLEAALPVYSGQTLHANADGYGLLWTGFGVGAFGWCADADQALAPLAAEHCLTDDRGALGSAAVPPVFRPTAPARDAVSRCGWGILGALYADGNHPAAAAHPGRDTRPGLRRAAFARRSGGAAGSRVRWRAAAISLGATGDRYLWPRLHPRRAGWPRLTVTASVATRKPLVFRHAGKEILATWMGSFPSIRVHLRSSVAKNEY
jgi:MFS family permease